MEHRTSRSAAKYQLPTRLVNAVYNTTTLGSEEALNASSASLASSRDNNKLSRLKRPHEQFLLRGGKAPKPTHNASRFCLHAAPSISSLVRQLSRLP